MTWITEHPKGVSVLLHVQPNAPKSELVGLHGDRLKVRIAAPPIEGAANKEIIRFFTQLLGVKRSQVAILAGKTGRQKRLLISDVDAASVEDIVLREV